MARPWASSRWTPRRCATWPLTGRAEELVELVERYCKEQGLFRTDDTPDPVFTDTLELDMSTVVPSLAGPKRPQDRVALAGGVKSSFRKALPELRSTDHASTHHGIDRTSGRSGDGAVVIAAITSCTNTSNPSVMVGAGLLAKKAVERGLQAKPWVKTSLAPGSKVVTRYLDAAGLTPYLEALGFYTVGYGCTTCIGNSGPLPDEVAGRRSGNAIWSWRRCSRATATSRAASIRWCAPTTWPARRWWWPMPWPARSTSI